MANSENKIVRFFQKEWEPVTYCGETFGWKTRLTGFAVGTAAGLLAGMVLFSSWIPELFVALLAGWIAQKWYVELLLERRKKDFQSQLCDYLDAVSTCLSCGRNPYDSFLSAEEVVQELYLEGAPIRTEGKNISEGLKNGRQIGEVLGIAAKESRCQDLRTYGEIYKSCSAAGGNLKKVTDESRNKLMEKILVEQEIKTVLAGPRNELNIMALIPFVILASLRSMSGDFLPDDGISMGTNIVALAIFVISYWMGRKMVQIKV